MWEGWCGLSRKSLPRWAEEVQREWAVVRVRKSVLLALLPLPGTAAPAGTAKP